MNYVPSRPAPSPPPRQKAPSKIVEPLKVDQSGNTTAGSSDSKNTQIVSGKSLHKPHVAASSFYDEMVDGQDDQNNTIPSQHSFHPEDTLRGYLKMTISQHKLGSNFFIKPVKSLGKQRWIVLSERLCKLFYYKSRGDTDALGGISLTGATFNYDPEDPDGLFCIISDSQTYDLAAGDDRTRQHWLDGLQKAKFHYINTSKEAVQLSPDVKWYTDLPSTGGPLPSPTANFVDRLHNTTSKFSNTIKSSAKNSFLSKGPFSRSSLLSPGSNANLPSIPSPSVTEPTDSGQQTRSQDGCPSTSSHLPLRPARSTSVIGRPTTLHFTDSTDRINNNSDVSEHEDLDSTLTTDTPCKNMSKSVEFSPEDQNKFLKSDMNKSGAVSPFKRTKALSKSFTFRQVSSVKSRHSVAFSNDRTSSDALHDQSFPSMNSKDGKAQQKLRNTIVSPGSDSRTGIRQIGADIKASITRYSVGQNRRGVSSIVSEEQMPDCTTCKQTLYRLEQCEERLDDRTEELAAAKQGISLLQQDLALLHRQQETQSSLNKSAHTDEHTLEILREKDCSLVTYEQSDVLQKNEIAVLQQQKQQLTEKVELLGTLITAKDHAIRSMANELEELKSRYEGNLNSLQLASHQTSFSHAAEGPLVRGHSIMPAHPYPSSSDQERRLVAESWQSALTASNEGPNTRQSVSAASSSQNDENEKKGSNSYQMGDDKTVEPVSSADDAAASYPCHIDAPNRKNLVPLPLDKSSLTSDSRACSDAAMQSSPVSCSNLFTSNRDASVLDSGSSIAHSSASIAPSPTASSCYSREQSIPDSVFSDSENTNEPMDSNEYTLINPTIEKTESTPSLVGNDTSRGNSSCVCDQNISLSNPNTSSVSAMSSNNKSLPSPRFYASSGNAEPPATVANSRSDVDQVYFHRGTSNGQSSRCSVDALVVLPVDEASEATEHDTTTETAWTEQGLKSDLLMASLTRTKQERDYFEESLYAYKAHNGFLHQQIISLTYTSDIVKKREERLQYECKIWEALFERVRSKYLVLLNDLHSPPCQQHDRDTLARMLTDALATTPDLTALVSGGKSYDASGFCISASDLDSLLRCSVFLGRQAQTVVKHQYEKDKQTEIAWESLLAATSNDRDVTLPLPDMQSLIREKGVPMEYRSKVWRLLVDHHVGAVRRKLPETYYEDLLARCIIRPSEDYSPSEVDEKTKKQIELDLLRTLPNNRYYENEFADNIVRLRRVLLAFAVHNRDIAYCQGLNRLAAIALLFLPETEAFWCLVCVVEHLMPEQYFTPRLLGPQIDQRVLRVLIADKLPRLHLHLNHYRLDISMITFNWFLCLFVEELPHALYLHIWDSFLLDGSKVMFRFALAILKLCEEGILARTDFMEVSNYLRSVPPPLNDIDRLRQAAFHWANPLRRRQLKRLRSLHNEEVMAEAAEQEIQRQQYQQKMAAEAATTLTAAQLLELDEKEEKDKQNQKEEIKLVEDEGGQEETEAGEHVLLSEQGLQQAAQDEQKRKEIERTNVQDEDERRGEGGPKLKEESAVHEEETRVPKLTEKPVEEIKEKMFSLNLTEPKLDTPDSRPEERSTPTQFFVPLPKSEPSTDDTSQRDQTDNIDNSGPVA